MTKQLEHMKETLMSCVQGQLGDLASVDAEELGAAIDMIKDLSEAVYYCTIVESMNEKEKEKQPMYFTVPMDYNRYYPMEYAGQGGNGGGGSRGYREMDFARGQMYYEGPMSYAQGGGQGGGQGGSRNYPDGNRQSSGESRNYPIEIRDYREGRSPMTRKNYMENKALHRGKEAQMKELDKYMHELTDDIMEMIDNASPEEKQMLQKKLSALATKIV